ncbi:MAG: carboxypeptidase regulatory-like domain-containing protein [Acidobacteriota bacterium]|nr:carboxypeptidase regulatory-like domain-containing protein [Acidobacteriota bacterium]
MRNLILGVVVLMLAGKFDIQAGSRQAPQPPPAQQPPQTQPPPAKPATTKPAQPQRRVARTATLAISVADPSGTPIPNVLVTVEGTASRSTRTEGGRIALEELPVGRYTVRFEQEGFITVERDLTATAGKPIEIKVTLKPLPAPPAAPAPPTPEPAARKPAIDAKPAMFDVPGVIEKEFVGRGAGKTTPLACGADGAASLIQLNQPLQSHVHDDADEFIYVVAGEGSASVQGATQKLKAGTLLFVPRGTSHGLTVSGRNPLIVLSTRAGRGC